jgi:sugar O-acyltransferase (sialic acid O-acetyltransferase NeuD family)
MTKPLVIAGAGGFGREVLGYIRDLELDLAGFVDDNPDALNTHETGSSIVASFADVDPREFTWLIAVGDPLVRRRLASRVTSGGGALGQLIHPTAYVSPTASLGPGTIICPFGFVANAASVGANVVVNTYASIGHDATIGDDTVFSPYAAANGNVELGNAVFLGTSAVVTPGKTVGAYSKVSAGTVCSRSFQPGSMIAGNPAKGRVMFQVLE